MTKRQFDFCIPDPVSSEDQWDGTDVEPGHPANIPAYNQEDGDQSYIESYRKGDKFS